MSLSRRIGRLEVVHAGTAPVCSSCGGFDVCNPGLAVTDHGRPLPSCPECGLHRDDKGRTLPPVYKRIVLIAGTPGDRV